MHDVTIARLFTLAAALACGVLAGFLSRRIAERQGWHLDGGRRDAVGMALAIGGILFANWVGWQVAVLTLIGIAASVFSPDIRDFLLGPRSDGPR